MRPSAAVLVLANLVPLFGAMLFQWSVLPILLLFWLENIVVGLFNVLKMIVVSPSDPKALLGKAFMIPFFCVHYGAFAAAHGFFVMGVFGNAFADRTVGGPPGPDMVIQFMREYHLAYAALFLAASHGFSFVSNFIGRGEYRRTSLGSLMAKPYSRVAVLHVTIIFGAFLVMSLGSSLPALIVLIGLKVSIDLAAHLREHKRLEPTAGPRDTD